MGKPEMPKAYEAKVYEDAIYAAWEKSGFFNPDNLKGEPFTIMMPPPNVTGVLHLGHALENTLMDSMIRYQRMRGRKALLVPGTDHAAVPTQARVEKMLMEEGIKFPRQELGREKLVERIRAFADASRATILSQIKKMGTSCDWSRLAYTFDDDRNKAVNELFTRMYRDGLIYRGYRVVNWSVKGQCTCSDDELEYVDRKAKLYTFKYSADFPFTIASTRPETKLGDTAVAVHPTDERYKSYIGKTFEVDFCGVPLRLSIIADDQVDPTFGTGALGVTPAHSPVDFVMYEKQKAIGNDIGIIPVIGPDGKMTSQAGKGFEGLTSEEAREKVVDHLREAGLLVMEEEIEQNVGTSDRFGDVVEAIPMTQWWLDVNKVIPGRNKTLRDLMREAVTTGLDGDATKKITIIPERETTRYLDRVENLRDWCLSRQIWWGHRIPVWYRGEEVRVGADVPAGEGWEQDPDTLDTWFSSASWTFSTLGWPEQTQDLKDFHPTDWMQMGYEILYLWLMRMVLMSAYVLEEIPFKDAYIHGMLRDKDGQKFSKSLNNGIDPIEVIEKYSADALRFAVVSGVSPGNDSRFYEEKVEAAQRLVNKLWNISRYILSSVDEVTHGRAFKELRLVTLADRWILSQLVRLEEDVSAHMQAAEFSQASEKLREFTWNDFADWYLEISKTQRNDEKTKASTDAILVYVLEHLLTYWHPIMPFVTEQIWSYLDDQELLLAHAWPVMRLIDLDLDAEIEMTRLQEVIGAIRNIRSLHGLTFKQLVNIRIQSEEELMKRFVRENSQVIKSLAGVSEIFDDVELREEMLATDSAVLGNTTVHVAISVDHEIQVRKLTAARKEKEQYIEMKKNKLANMDLSKTPVRIVEKMKFELEQAEQERAGIIIQLQAYE
ncbi:MAG: valine--tRNA ligase [Patescibacteria group bacterium]